MKRFTARFAHLETLPAHKVGDVIKRGDIVGRMGNTGKSTGAHLHLDVVVGWYHRLYRLSDIANHDPAPCPLELNYFIDSELFGVDPIITTYYYDPRYGRPHPGYDLVPQTWKEKTNYDIKWNRSHDGEVLLVGNDSGYGNFIMIGYTT